MNISCTTCLYDLYLQKAKTGELEINNTNSDDSGRYTCVARNKIGTARDSIELQVGSVPRVVYVPKGKQII